MTPLVTIPALHLAYDLKETRAALRKVAQAAARDARKAASRSSGGGRTYSMGGRRYTASAPGEAPVKRTGALAKSIRARAGGRKKLSARVVAGAYYSTMMEVGSDGGGGRKGNTNRKGRNSTRRTQAPRPFIQNAVEGKMDDAGTSIVEAINKSLALKAGKAAAKRRS